MLLNLTASRAVIFSFSRNEATGSSQRKNLTADQVFSRTASRKNASINTVPSSVMLTLVAAGTDASAGSKQMDGDAQRSQLTAVIVGVMAVTVMTVMMLQCCKFIYKIKCRICFNVNE
jgi:hypothetical protein